MSMRTTFRRATTLLSVYYAYMAEYRAEIFFWAIANALPLVMLGLWVQASERADLGMTPTELARYFVAAYLVRQMTVVWVIWEFEQYIVEGKLSPLLLQPMNPVWHFVAQHLAERMMRLPFALLLLGVVWLVYPDALWIPTWQNLLLGFVAMNLAFVVRFIIQYAFTMLGFWMERASAVEQFWWLIYLFLSGLLAPLSLFPEPVRQFALFTPFPYLLYFPANLLVRGETGLGVSITQGFVVLTLWGVAGYALYRWLWRAGLKQYAAMGA